VIFAAVMTLCITVLAGCSRPPSEQVLRETIASMQAASEARDVDALFEPIAEDFAAAEGMDRQRFRAYVAILMLRNRSIGASIGPLDVQMLGDRARVDFNLLLTGGMGALPDSANVYRVQTGWRMEDGEWKLISAEWKASL
jgi:ketosteroid isomerase-like protein